MGYGLWHVIIFEKDISITYIMDILYNNKPIYYNDVLTPSQTSTLPSVKINDLGYNFYTLIMYDPDAIDGTYWHWISANIDLENDATKNIGNIILDYEGPNPPDSKIHHYVFELYGTNHKIDVAKFVSRNVSLGEGKKMLNIENNPILFTRFLSEKAKRKTGGRSKSKKTKNRKRKITRKKNA